MMFGKELLCSSKKGSKIIFANSRMLKIKKKVKIIISAFKALIVVEKKI